MAVAGTLKSAVPLSLKDAYHAHKSLPREAVVRLVDRLRGNPPLPPGELIELVAGHRNPAWFPRGGPFASEAVRAMVARHGAGVERMGDILDFGCVVGHIMRRWRARPGRAFSGLITTCASSNGAGEIFVSPGSGRTR